MNGHVLNRSLRRLVKVSVDIIDTGQDDKLIRVKITCKLSGNGVLFNYGRSTL